MTDPTAKIHVSAAEFSVVSTSLSTLVGAGILSGDDGYRLLVGSGVIDDVRAGAWAQSRAGKIDKALEILGRYGGIDGSHHKDWVIDQAVRALTGDNYEAWVAEMCNGEDGPNTYEWNTGIAP